MKRTFTCEKCQKEFQNKRGLHNHHKRKIPCNIDLKCNLCNKTFNTIFLFERHQNRKTSCVSKNYYRPVEDEIKILDKKKEIELEILDKELEILEKKGEIDLKKIEAQKRKELDVEHTKLEISKEKIRSRNTVHIKKDLYSEEENLDEIPVYECDEGYISEDDSIEYIEDDENNSDDDEYDIELYKNTPLIYVINNRELSKSETYKIGKTTNLKQRMCTYNCTIDHKILYIRKCNKSDLDIIENVIKHKLKEYRVNPKKELFSGELEEIIQVIEDVAESIES